MLLNMTQYNKLSDIYICNHMYHIVMTDLMCIYISIYLERLINFSTQNVTAVETDYYI